VSQDPPQVRHPSTPGRPDPSGPHYSASEYTPEHEAQG
jgi:hypothetical protein